MIRGRLITLISSKVFKALALGTAFLWLASCTPTDPNFFNVTKRFEKSTNFEVGTATQVIEFQNECSPETIDVQVKSDKMSSWESLVLMPSQDFTLAGAQSIGQPIIEFRCQDEGHYIVRLSLSLVSITSSDSQGLKAVSVRHITGAKDVSKTILNINYKKPKVTFLSTEVINTVEGLTAQVSFVIDKAIDRDVVVGFQTVDVVGGAVYGDDYSVSGSTATILAGETHGTYPIDILNDAITEPDEPFTLRIRQESIENAELEDGFTQIDKVVQITTLPTLSIGDVTVNEVDSTASFTVNLSAASTDPISFEWASTDVTAEAGIDYTAGSGTETITPGNLSHTLVVSLMPDDALDEIDETFVIDLSNVSNAVISTGQGIGTITDNDSPPTLTIASVSGVEGTDQTFNVSLSAVSGKDISVDFTTSNGTAVAGSDYTAISGSLSIPAGSLAGSFDVVIPDDLLNEADKSYNVAISNPVNATIATSSATGTITDNDAVPSVSIDDVTVDESNSTMVFTVTLSAVSGQDVTFDWGTADGTAVLGSDYISVPSASATIFAGGSSASITVNLPVDDSLSEPTETFLVNLSNPVNATLSDNQGVGTITDNDGPPSLSINDVTVNESDSTVSFLVTLSAASGQNVSFDWASADATATAGSDYTAGSNTSETITAGNTTATITINLAADDTIDEVDETFELNLSNASQATISDGQGIATIQDNDATPTLSLTNVSGAEGSNQTFTVSLSAASGLDVSFDYATTDGTALAGSDYTANSGSLTIPAGSTSANFMITIADDTLDEADENYTVTLSNPLNATIPVPSVTGTITDNDAMPSLTIDDVTVDESQSSASFTVSLSAVSGQDVSFDWTTADATATAGVDYTTNSNISETIAAGASSATITISLVADDALYELDETFEVNLSNPSHATLFDAQGIGTITDNDPMPTLSLADVSGAEDSNQTFTITLSAASGLDVSFDYATSNGTAVAGTDYTANSGSLTITAGNTSHQFTVVIADDAISEPSENYTATISNPTNATIITASATGTITDNEGLPSLTIGDVTVNESESTVDFTVTLSAVSGQDVDFDWASADATAAAGSDYTAISSSTETIIAGQTTKTLTVSLTGDSLDEADETFEINLSNPVNATISDSQGIATITDDDATPTLSLASMSRAEDSDQTFTVTLSAVSGRDVSFDYATSNGTAVAGSDYTANSGSLTIDAGQTSKTFTVIVADDTLDEEDESFTVAISNASHATIATGSATGTITDNDATPSLSLADVTVNESSSSVDLTVTLSAASGRDVNFNWASANATAIAGSDYTAIGNTTETITAGQTTKTLTVLLTEDSLDEVDETFEINLSTPVNATISDSQGIVTITDNDSTPTLSIANVGLAEDNNHVFTVTLSAQSGQDVSFDYATSDGTATAGSDYTATSGSLTFSVGETTKTFTVIVADDALDESNENYTVTINNPSNATIPTGTATGTIVDNDATPTLSINDVTVNESDSTAQFTVTLSAISGQNVSFDWATSDVTASAGSDVNTGDDYTAASNATEPITAGNTTATITINLLGDDLIDEENETFEVTLTNASNATFSDDKGTATITDDDTAQLVINDVTVTEGASAQATFTVSTVGGVTSKNDMKFKYHTQAGTASSNDYTEVTLGSNTEETIYPDNSSITISIPITQDNIDELSQDFNVILYGPTNVAISDNSGNAIINDNNPNPLLYFDVSSSSEEEGTGSIDFNVNLTRESEKSITFNWETTTPTPATGIATPGTDFTSRSESFTYPINTISQTFTVNIIDDSTEEPDETIEVKISGQTNTLDGNDLIDFLTIEDDDDTTPPANVVGFRAPLIWDDTNKSPTFTWEANTEPDFSHYVITIKKVDDSLVAISTNITSGESYQFTTGITLNLEDSYYAEIVAHDTSGNTSSTTRSMNGGIDFWVMLPSDYATDIYAGGDHACAIVNSEAYCWGDNTNGKLGDGTTTNKAVPTLVSSLGSGVQSMALGQEHTCAIVHGQLWCWGRNDKGEVGDGSTTTRLSPVSVDWSSITPSVSDYGVTSVGVGSNHTCATKNGALYCWGQRFYGQLGDGSTSGSSYVPALVPGLATGVTSVSSGNRHSCAIVEGGLKCWGQGSYGKLGNNSSSTQSSPVDVSGLGAGSGVTDVSLGGFHSCAVINGEAKCWGLGASGQIGDGNYTDQWVPTPVQGLTAGVTSISVGNDYSCAVQHGSLHCWGGNSSGQFGNGTTTDSATPQLIPGANGVKKLSAGLSHTCALINGRAMCWGENGTNQLGDGTTTNRTTPVAVSGLGVGVLQVSAGWRHACILIGGGVQCWGENTYGQLGDGTTTDRSVPTAVVGLGDINSGVVQIEVDGYKHADSNFQGGHSCAVVDGGVKCWGRNLYGQVGDNGSLGTSEFRSTPVDVKDDGGVDLTDVDSIYLGGHHSCAVRNGGAVCWGYNGHKNLGVASDFTHRSYFKEVVNLGEGSGVVSLSLGYNSTCALVNDGVKCWGYDHVGQLGNNDVFDSPQTHLPQDVKDRNNSGALAGITQIASGPEHHCALQNGEVLCWGNNDYYQLGNGSTTHAKYPVAANTFGLEDNTAVFVGGQRTCTTNTQDVKCVGNNQFQPSGSLGSLGVGDTTNINVTSANAISSPVGSSGTHLLDLGIGFGCALNGSDLYCWGENEKGQLGLGDSEIGIDKDSPQSVLF